MTLVQAEAARDHLGGLVKQHADLLIYEVVEHAAAKALRYITRTRAEYWRFLRSSMGGGLLVAFFALAKLKLAALSLPLAGEALAYSLNYALCFVLIYVTGATLATKQPAVTAHSLAASLDGPGDRHHLDRMVEMVAQAWRSQFISFVGNLSVAFPVGLLLSLAWHAATGAPLIDPAKAGGLLAELHPWQSLALVHAGIAGVYLFASGLVAGWVDTRLVYSQIPERIGWHQGLLRVLGPQGAQRVASLVPDKAGALLGNVFLGFCLGSTGVLGHILGLPLDIRHIAFASAHLAVGLDGVAASLPAAQVAALAGGVVSIGFVNFIVSFGLALLLAVESRRLSFTEGRQLLRMLAGRLARRPLDFFFPPPERR